MLYIQVTTRPNWNFEVYLTQPVNEDYIQVLNLAVEQGVGRTPDTNYLEDW